MPRPADPRSTGEPPAPAGERIAKLLARAGVASRREVERMIAEGRVALRGVVIDTAATVLPTLDGITVDGDAVAAPEPTRLFLYHKPVGLLVTERDPRGRPTIYDRLPADLPRVVPVGRLDLNTEGLLLLTTDGGFKRQLELPATGVERTYRARAYGNVTQAQLETLIEGVEIEGIRYGSIDANLERRTGANVWVELTLTEGKNREVRRVLEYCGLQVSRLIRTRYGPFVLGDLPPGEVGEIKGSDIATFRRTLKGGAPAEPITAEPRAGFRSAPAADRPARARSGPRTREAVPSKPAGQTVARALVPPSSTRASSPKPQPGTGRRSSAAPRDRSAVAAAQTRRPTPVDVGARRTRDSGPLHHQPEKPAAAPVRRQSATARPALAERRDPASTSRDRTASRPTDGHRVGPSATDTTPRPPKPVRKTGWAKAKPKSGAKPGPKPGSRPKPQR